MSAEIQFFHCNVTDMTDFSALYHLYTTNDVIWLSSDLIDSCSLCTVNVHIHRTSSVSFVLLMFTFTEHYLLVLYC